MSRVTTCPHCSTRLRVSEQITDKTLICPHCLADVDNPQSTYQIQAADIDTDVKRGLSLGSIILAVLIGLCVLGIIMAFLALRTGKGDFGAGISLLFCFALLDALVGIAIVRGLIHWGISGVRSPSVGRVIGIVFLSLGTMVAAVIFFFFTCVFLMISS